MVTELHSIFQSATREAYEVKTTKKKSNQPQWINSYVLCLISIRRAIFRREGRSQEWKRIKKKTRRVISKRKKEFNKQRREKRLNCDSRTFHKAVKAVISDEKTKHWTPRDMFPDLSAQQVADKCADYFNGISAQYEPLDLNKIPLTHESAPLRVTAQQVQSEVTKGKKPKARVPGDIFIDVLVKNIKLLAPIIAKIYNRIIETAEWPKAWLTEHVTVIPKGNIPEDPSGCRNISCTNFLSKVLERIILKYAKKEVRTKQNQFGGEKVCSTNHFLAEVIDQITDHIEDPRAAAVLTSIDYSKAFNRLDHNACLVSFANKGASNQLLRLLASFLQGRQMTVRVDDQNSTLRTVNAGAPQGSVLGTYIFNMGTNELEDGAEDPHEDPPLTYELDEGDLLFLELGPEEGVAQSTPIRSAQSGSPGVSPIRHAPRGSFVILPNARNIPHHLSTRIEQTWRPKNITVKKFVDDNLQNEKLYMKNVPTIKFNDDFVRNARAGKSEHMFKHISDRARRKGLLVNTAKTALLTVSGAVSYTARSHI